MGELVNSVFAGSRLDRQKIVKKSHYEQGASSVFKKIGEYLLGCERMPKQNVLALLDEIDTGYMRE
jgi:Golgi nucleoside diphosphatase